MRKTALSIFFLFLAVTCEAAVSLDGTNDCISPPSSITFGTNVVSLSIWVDGLSSSGAQAWMELTPDSGDGNFAIFMNDSGASTIGATVIHGGYRFENISIPSMPCHLGFVFDNSTTTGDVKIYVNGVEQSTGLYLNTKAGNGNFQTGKLYFGARTCSAFPGPGVIDDVVVFSGELTAGEFALLAASKNKGIPYQIDNARILHLPLNECSDGAACTTASMFKDQSGNGNNYSPTNSPTGKGTTLQSP